MKFYEYARLYKSCFSALLMFFLFGAVSAQAQITAPDTACVGNPVNFYSQQQNTTYSWMIDTASLLISQTPGASLPFYTNSLSTPSYSVYTNDSGNYYIFTTNAGTNTILRLFYTNNLNNTPIPVNVDSNGIGFTNTSRMEGIDVVKDTAANTWYGLVVDDQQMALLTFGTTLANQPAVTMMNFPGVLNWAHQVTIKKYNGQWIAFVANRSGSIVRFDFGTSLSNTPTSTVIPNVANLATPCNFAIHEQAGNWYMLVNDLVDGTLVRLDFGTDLQNNAPTGTNLGNFGGLYNLPRSICLLSNCDTLIAYTLDETFGSLVTLNFQNDITNIPIASATGAANTGNYNSMIAYVYSNHLNFLLTSYGHNELDNFPILNLPNPATNTFYYNPNFTYTFTAPGIYDITLFNDMGYYAGGSSSCRQIVIEPVGITSVIDTTICNGTTGILSAGFPGPYIWNTGDTTDSISITLPGTYYVTGPHQYCGTFTDTFHVSTLDFTYVNAGPDTTTCINFPLQLSAIMTSTPQAGVTYTYQWTPDANISNDTAHNPIVTPPSSTTYSVVVLQNGNALCSVPDQTVVTVLEGYTVLNHDTIICKGSTVQLNLVGDPRYHYTWTPSEGLSDTTIINPVATPDTTTTYRVSANYPGCTDSVTAITIAVQPIPIITAPDMSTCIGDTLMFNTYVAPAYPNYSFVWTPGGSLVDSQVLDPLFFGDTTTMFHIAITTPIGCADTDSMTVTVYPGGFNRILTGDTAICPRDSIRLVDTGGVMFSWTPGTGLSDSTNATPMASPSATTFYTVYSKDTHGCRDTAHVNVVVFPAPLLDLGDSVTVYPGQSYQINPQTNCVTVNWFPPAGLSATNIVDPVITVDANTKYIVTGTTADGCSTTDSLDVYADPNVLIALPNAFTPGNGPNNVLKILTRGAATLHYFRIFNRWGTKVFEATNIEDGWDGTYNGAPQPLGVYVYEIEAETITGHRFYKQGNITLLR